MQWPSRSLVERSLPELKTFAHFVALVSDADPEQQSGSEPEMKSNTTQNHPKSDSTNIWTRMRFNKHSANLRRNTVGLPPTLRSGRFAMQWVVPWWACSLNNSLNQWLHHTKHLEPSCMTAFLHNSSMVEDTNLVGIPDGWEPPQGHASWQRGSLVNR